MSLGKEIQRREHWHTKQYTNWTSKGYKGSKASGDKLNDDSLWIRKQEVPSRLKQLDADDKV